MAASYIVIFGDKAIYKDGVSITGCDMSNLPRNFWALQWDGSNGHVEFNDGSPNKEVKSKSEIEKVLGISLNEIIARRDARISELKK